MYISVSDHIRKLAFMVDDNYFGDSPYLNIPFYQQRTEPEEDSREIGDGPLGPGDVPLRKKHV